MPNYSVLFNKENDRYYVLENKTGQFITSFTSRSTAKTFAKYANAGRGFDGWTPAFILTDAVVAEVA